MAYSVHNFEQGDILYASQLNEMDAQIALNEENISTGISADMLAEDYSANKTYSIGDYVIYNDQLYTCIYEITAPEGWNSAHWQIANLGDGISHLNNAIGDIKNLGNITNESIDFSVIRSGVYAFVASNNPTGLPTDSYGQNNYLIVLRKNNTALSTQDRQYLYVNGVLKYTRVYFSGAWQDWTIYPKIGFREIGRSSFDPNVLETGVYTFTATTAYNNLPDIPYGAGALLICVRDNDTSFTKWDKQYIITLQHIATRVYSGGWGDWAVNQIAPQIISYGSTPPSDLKSLPSGLYYTVSATIPENYPKISISGGAYILVERKTEGVNTNFDTITVITKYAKATTFYHSGAWTDWYPYDGIINCGVGQEYTTLKSAVIAGAYYGCKVVVHPGVYDLTLEFADEIATASTTGRTGNELKNGIHLFFMPGAYVRAIFDSSNTWAHEYFNPFHSSGDFILEGLNIEAQNTRYCVHDEHGGMTVPYHHEYINCTMKYTNTISGSQIVQCIGGGLGENGSIDIDGGVFESVSNLSGPTISWHNSQFADSDGRITIKNVYLKNDGYLRFGSYGPSEIKTPVYVCGCSMGASIVLTYEDSSQYEVVNFDLTEWNNTVRS